MTRAKPLTFLDLVAGLDLTLTPAQREFARVAYDGGVPCGCPECVVLWGAAEWGVVKPARKVASAVCGRGSGKSLLGGLRVLHLAMTVDLSGLAARERAECPVIAPDMETAEQVVRFALGAAERLRLRISGRVKGGDAGFVIERAGGKKVLIVARSASTRGRSVRGRSMPCVVMDEACFFYDSSHRINDQDIFDAAKHRIMPGGQIVILSSPWTETGLLYDMWRRNFGKPFDALVAHAPTGLMRVDDAETLAAIEIERKVDPEKCARERDAHFMTANAAAFFDPRAVAGAFSDGPEPENVLGATRAVGGDFAFRRNSTAFVAVQLRNAEGRNIYEVLDLYEKRPEGTPLKPSEVCREGVDFAKAAEVDEIVADSHYRETVVEELGRGGIAHVIAPEGASGKADVFQTARSLLHEGLVRIPTSLNGSAELADKLKQQLREVTARPLAGGGLTIESPLWRTGEHGDLVSAFVLALWRVYKLGWVPIEMSAATRAAEEAGIDELERTLMAQEAAREERLDRLERFTGLRGRH